MPRITVIRDLINRKTKLLESDDDLASSIRATENSLFSILKKVLQRFTLKAGRFVGDVGDSTLFARLQNQILDAISESTYGSKIGKYLKNFDEVQKVSIDLLSEINDTSIKLPNINREKKLIVGELIENLTKPASIGVNIVNPLRKILYQQITSGVTYEEAENALRTYIKGPNGNGGQLSRYVTQLTRDAINQFDGTIQNEVRKDLGLDGFRFAGSLLVDAKTGKYKSRPNCVHMVNGTGGLERFAIKPGLYRIKDLPDIFKVIQNGKGWNPATTVDSYMIYRNGYNCRHQIIPVQLTNSEQLKALEKGLN